MGVDFSNVEDKTHSDEHSEMTFVVDGNVVNLKR